MANYIYDYEVTKYDWLMVAYGEDKQFVVIHNDTEALQGWLEENPFLIGFNNKHYDRYILAACEHGYTPEDVKKVNDYIIGGGNGWECPLLKGVKVRQQCDLRDDMQVGLSLKSIEAHLGMNITETTVDFDIDRRWTDEELERMIYYCKADVLATRKLYDLRKDYIKNKVQLGKECGLSTHEAMCLTNAKLTAKFLKANKKTFTDEREYKYPSNLLREYIPDEVFKFFDRMHDDSISDDDLWSGKLDIDVGGCPVTLGFGGIHGAIPTYTETATDTRTIRNKDVASYYPNTMRVMNFCSRAIPDNTLYAKTIARRVEAKRSGDKAVANALKLVLNTTYGAMLDKHNDLYDPLMGRSVCITGQLFLLELSEHLVKECPSLKIIQLNTDGIMVSFDNTDEEKWQSITQEWQNRTGFELEEDFISKIVQKDVNNYVEVATNGDVKKKGGLLVRGISSAGAFNINYNATIVAYALELYLSQGIPIEDTINNETSELCFSMIAKASGKYSKCLHKIGDEFVEVQKVSRVYAGNDYRKGTIYKQTENGNPEKIANLPLCCEVDNDNHITMVDINKEWYINLAKRQADMFLGTTEGARNTREINKMKKEILLMLGVL